MIGINDRVSDVKLIDQCVAPVALELALVLGCLHNLLALKGQARVGSAPTE